MRSASKLRLKKKITIFSVFKFWDTELKLANQKQKYSGSGKEREKKTKAGVILSILLSALAF